MARAGNEYREVINLLKEYLEPKQIVWLSLGLLRFTPALKPIVEARFPASKIIYGSFSPPDKKMRYPEIIRIKVFQQMVNWLQEWSVELPIYFCMESAEVWAKVLADGLLK
jgi:spore photoproduct lyase